MKITIDTKEDSPQEIKNAIKMLSSLIGEKVLTNQPNIFENTSPEVSPAGQANVFGNLFGDSQKSADETEPADEPKIEEKEEIKEDSPSITEYY